MNIIEVAAIMRKHKIKLLLWKEDYPKCIVQERTVLIPTQWLDSNQLSNISLALIHEVEHLNHSTFDHRKLSHSDEEFFVLNCLEDTRIDLDLIERYKIYGLYQKVYRKMFKDKTFNRVSFLKRVCWGTMLIVLNIKDVVKLRKPVADFIEKHDMTALFLRGVGLLNDLEDDPCGQTYGNARKFIKGLTQYIKTRGKKIVKVTIGGR